MVSRERGAKSYKSQVVSKILFRSFWVGTNPSSPHTFCFIQVTSISQLENYNRTIYLRTLPIVSFFIICCKMKIIPKISFLTLE